MEDIKLSLTIVLPGSTMMSEQECSKNSSENYNHFTMTVGSKHDRKTIHFATRKCKPARMVMNLGLETYNYFTAKSKNRRTDAQNCPSWSRPDIWYNLSVEQRLKKHLARITADRGGISYTYAVFED
jgi:hypothetical protein